ncbi:RiPP maturation radical SAM C-methyltransferase [Desulfosoma caldarium]|uniref:Ribosomal peptide maturation radical SAM protein 1 n=1 Tax=Desulfosoma caldarium TaxID=610254 RepID=A0A3N1UR80_9BACT|nr:RiPP maturation radical SAM C-methyltransferase [Desulfosoma caldarium]ROQ91210.1 ribosomal peptide maturation radical SAM protein 1 [Desulfosoma caldarium]
MRVVLVSMPWALADRPSIQLGALKAFVTQQFSNRLHVMTAHPYLSVARDLGRCLYQRIAQRSWLGEAVYGALLFPERFVACEKLFQRQWRRFKAGFAPNFQQIVLTVQRLHETMPLWAHLEQAHVVGFSVCFAQLTSSLYLARAVKKRVPAAHIVFGGSLVSGSLGKSVMELFPWVDFVISGEGEKPLVRLLSRLLEAHEGRLNHGDSWSAGIYYRLEKDQVGGGGLDQMTNLEDLPLPDYADFFQEAALLEERTPIFALPVESSRGCWWHKVREDKPNRRGCRFCNLNVQWRGYRSKKPDRIAMELQTLAQRHGSLRFVFVDNALNSARLLETAAKLQRTGKDFDLFGEVRLPLSRAQVRALRRAGFQKIQAGVEALSNALLRRLGKGTRLIDNVAWMRHCEEFGIENRSNLLLEFPGTTSEEVQETLAVLRLITIFRPLKGVSFWLGEGSPVAMNATAHGLCAVGNHPYYAALFPEKLYRRGRFLIKTYRGDRSHQRRLWQPVRQRLAAWQKEDAAFRAQTGGMTPRLGYSDGGEFLLIRRRDQEGQVNETFRLSGPSRDIYLSCLDPVPLEDLHSKHGRFSSRSLEGFLRDMVAKGLVFESQGWFLSLAVREGVQKFFMAGDGAEPSVRDRAS